MGAMSALTVQVYKVPATNMRSPRNSIQGRLRRWHEDHDDRHLVFSVRFPRRGGAAPSVRAGLDEANLNSTKLHTARVIT
jgi:hypothetical protein